MTDPVPGALRRDPSGDVTDVVMGIDIGGSSTRAVAMDRNGVAGPIGRSAGGNPSTRRTEEIAAALSSAMDAALAGWHRSSVGAIVVGLAGLDESHRPELEATIRAAVRSIGVHVEPLLRTDAEIAFAAGTVSPDGLILIAGTGAITARIRNRREVATVDGHGWRLGDAGSGYWLGAAVLRRVLEALDGRRPPTAMTAAVLHHIASRAGTDAHRGNTAGEADDPRWRIIRATLPMHPSDVATFAGIALSGHDDAARALVDDAAAELERSALALGPRAGEPIVLAGGVLRGSRLAGVLCERLAAHGLTATPLDVEPVTGAAALAADAVGWPR